MLKISTTLQKLLEVSGHRAFFNWETWEEKLSYSASAIFSDAMTSFTSPVNNALRGFDLNTLIMFLTLCR